MMPRRTRHGRGRGGAGEKSIYHKSNLTSLRSAPPRNNSCFIGALNCTSDVSLSGLLVVNAFPGRERLDIFFASTNVSHRRDIATRRY